MFEEHVKTLAGDDPKLYLFNESFRISPYLYAIVAGPFGFHER